MATYRVGIGSFNLKDGAVGLGTEASGLGNLKVEGTYKTTDLDVIGVSTFQRYAGFAADKVNILRDTSLSSEHSTIGDIVVGLNSTFTVSAGATVTVGTVESVSIGTHFSPPTGGVEERPEAPVEGTVRFNTDLNTLEFYNGVEWRQFTVNGSSGRAIHNNHYNISTFNLTTGGDTTNFGTSVTDRTQGGAFSSSTRGIFVGDSSMSTNMDYVTIASEGNAIDFGNSSQGRRYGSGCSSSTRGLYAGGRTPSNVNTIDYVEIPTVGDAIDFGDLTITGQTYNTGCGSPTRGLFGGTANAPGNGGIDQVTIASKGNATKFGLSGFGGGYFAGTSNSVRALFGGRRTPGQGLSVGDVNTVIIASDGNGTYFGELTEARVFASATSSQTRGVWMGGKLQQSPLTETYTTRIDSFNFDSAGNAVGFGDLSYVHSDGRTDLSCAISDSHGGLGGI